MCFFVTKKANISYCRWKGGLGKEREHMRRVLLALFGIIVWALPMPSQAEAVTKIAIDGKEVTYSSQEGVPFIDAAGRTQVPFRQTMEEFGCDVSWNEAQKTAIATKNGIQVEVPIGASYVYRNGEKIENDTAALIKDGRTYLPIRVVLESFGASVQWNAATSTVVVSTTGTGEQIEVHFLDVGQGDSILIDDQDFEILIDGGVAAEGKEVVEYVSHYVDGSLDVLIATHEDADHIGGLSAVLEAYQVDRIIDNGRTANTKTYQTYKNHVNAEGATYQTDEMVQQISLPCGGPLQIIPMVGQYEDSNDNSVVSVLDYQDIEILLTGDLSTEVSDLNLSRFYDIDVLKAGHHGSRTSVNTAFLKTVQPEIVIISAGLDNSYGHPHAEALAAYLDCGANVYGTFRSGDIVLTTDGTQMFLDTDKKLTMADVGATTTGQTQQQPVSQPTETPQQPSNPPTETPQQPIQNTAVYIGNKNSKVFHKADCSSVKRMKESNKVTLSSKEQAIAQGYTPCKVCQP